MPRQKILIIDDEPEYVRVLHDFLKSFGYEVYLGADQQEGLALSRRHMPRVVLLDFKMPGLSGENFLSQLQDINPHVRTIVITGCIPEEVEDKFKGLGYFGFFIKGEMSLEELRRKVEEALTE